MSSNTDLAARVASLEKALSDLTIKYEKIIDGIYADMGELKEGRTGPVLEVTLLPNARPVKDGDSFIEFRTMLRHISDVFMIRSGGFRPGDVFAFLYAGPDAPCGYTQLNCIEQGVLRIPGGTANCKYVKIVRLTGYHPHPLDKRDGIEVIGVQYIGFN